MKFFKDKGYLEKIKFIDKTVLKDLEDLYNHELNKNAEKIVKIDFVKLDNFKILNSINKSLIEFVKKEIGLNIVLRNIWLQRSTYETVHTGLPYIPHIDKKRYFKIFLYLNDIKIENGPLNVSTNSIIADNEIKRKQWWHNVSDKSIDQINKENAHGVVEKNKNINFKPLCLPAGSIIGLDTNCAHFAGHIKKGFKRKILRFNYYSNFENSFDIKYLRKKFLLNLIKIKNCYVN